MKVLLCLLIFGVINTISSGPVQDGVFKDFVKSIADNLNRTANPCTDFTSFACSTLKKAELKDGYEVISYMKLLNEKPTTTVETMMQKFFQSCEKLSGNWPYKPEVQGKINLSKIFEQIDILKANAKWPAETNYDSNKLSVLLGEMMSIFELTNYMYIEANNGKLEIFAPKMGGEYPQYKKDLPTSIARTMKSYYPKNEAAIDKAIQDITVFETKLEEIGKENVEIVSLPVAQVTGLNWPELIKVVQKNWFLTGNMEAIVTDSRIVKIVKLISETDSKTIVNHLIYKLIDYVQGITYDGCVGQFYFQTGLMDLIWRDIIFEQDHKNYIDILNQFTKSFKDAETKLGANDPERETEEELKLTRECFEQRDAWFKQLYYDKVEIQDNLLQSVVNIGKLPIYSHKVNIRDNLGIRMMTFDFLLQQFRKMQLHNKPILFYYATKNIQLWSRAFDSNEGWIKTEESVFGQCLETKQNVKIPSYDLSDVLRIFATSVYNLNDFKNYQNNLDKKQVEMENQILKQHTLNHLQAYFISLKQMECDDSNYINIAFANSKEFSDAFQCKTDEPMNPKDKCNVE